MRFLLISLVVPLLLQACSPATTKGMTEQRSSVSTVRNPYFSQADVDYLYKMNIQFKEHSFGGLLVVKKIDDQHHRLVMMGEMGNKFLDLTVGSGKTVKNFTIPELDKRLLLRVLSTDLAMMVNENVTVKKEFGLDGEQVFLSRQGEGRQYLFFAEPSGDLLRIVRRGYGMERVDLRFIRSEEGSAEQTTITHLTRPLIIDLKRIYN